MKTNQEEPTKKNGQRRKEGAAKRKWSSKEKHRKELKQEAVARMADHKPVADTSRTFHFVLRLLLEEQLTLFHGRALKTLPSKVRLARLIETTLFAIYTDMHRLSNNVARVLLDEQQRLQANPGLKIAERLAAFQLLDLPPEASVEDIKSSYKELARKAHPDVGGDTERMQVLNAAYSLLMEEFNGSHAEELGGHQPSQDT